VCVCRSIYGDRRSHNLRGDNLRGDRGNRSDIIYNFGKSRAGVCAHIAALTNVRILVCVCVCVYAINALKTS